MTARLRATPPAVDADERRFRDAEFDALPAWRRGEVVPARITMLLDARGLYGPDVDRAYGAAEPAVDEWEAGTRYPTWPQLVALARLVGALPTWFVQPLDGGTRPVLFVCDRRRPSRSVVVQPDPRITCYPEAVWRATVDGPEDTLW